MNYLSILSVSAVFITGDKEDPNSQGTHGRDLEVCQALRFRSVSVVLFEMCTKCFCRHNMFARVA